MKTSAATTTVEDLLPVYSRREVHRRTYAATAADVRAALESLRPADLPIARLLFVVRGLPLLLKGKNPLAMAELGGATLVDQLERGGFTRVVDTPREVLLVVIGKFWQLDGGRVPVADAAAFASFSDPGYAKGTFGFALHEAAGGTELVTETRVVGTDAGAERRLGAYWLLIRGGSGLIRHEILGAVGRKLRPAG